MDSERVRNELTWRDVLARAYLDRLWREHLAACAELRDGMYLVRLGGQDPLARFTTEARAGFKRLTEALAAPRRDTAGGDLRSSTPPS